MLPQLPTCSDKRQSLRDIKSPVLLFKGVFDSAADAVLVRMIIKYVKRSSV